MVRKTHGAASLKRVAALLLATIALSLAGCSGSETPSLEVQPDYLDFLRGANSLAHGTAEQPPKAALAASAHAAALLLARGEKVDINPSFWRSLVTPSGEDAGWVVYYMCLIGADQDTMNQIVDEPVAKVVSEMPGGVEVHEAVSGNAALEQLTGRRVRTCVGQTAASGPIEVSETNAVIIKARLSRAGFGDSSPTSDAEIEHVVSLITEQGCTDWNQASSWAVFILRPEAQNPVLKDCREATDLPLTDPVGLHVSLELGMPADQAEKRAPSEELRTWLTSDWTSRNPSQESVGNGTVANTVSLVELTRLKGWAIPTWVPDGVAEASRTHQGQDAALTFLCQATQAACDPAIQVSVPSQREIAPKVLDGSLADGDGRLMALASLENVEVQEGLCDGMAAELYRVAPQTYSALAAVDKTCWEPLTPSTDELTERIVSTIRQGNLDDARALMLLTEAVHGKVAIKDEMVPRVEQAWASALATVEEEKGKDFLPRARPLSFMLFSTALKEWSS